MPVYREPEPRQRGTVAWTEGAGRHEVQDGMTSRIDNDLPLQRRNTLWIEEYLTRLGDQVRAARARRGMSRRILARDPGVSERYLAQLESGRGNPSVAVLHQVADAMDMSMMELADPDAGSDPALSEIQALLAPLAPAELSEAAEILARHFADSGTRGRRISLIGLRGAGKTTLGKALADTLGFLFSNLTGKSKRTMVPASASYSLSKPASIPAV